MSVPVQREDVHRRHEARWFWSTPGCTCHAVRQGATAPRTAGLKSGRTRLGELLTHLCSYYDKRKRKEKKIEFTVNTFQKFFFVSSRFFVCIFSFKLVLIVSCKFFVTINH